MTPSIPPEFTNEPMPALDGKQIRKGTGDVLKDIAYAQRFTESLQDQWPGQMGLELDFVDRALRVAAGEIKRLREAVKVAKAKAEGLTHG